MNQIQNASLQKNKLMNPRIQGIQNLVAWSAAPGVTLGSVTYSPTASSCCLWKGMGLL